MNPENHYHNKDKDKGLIFICPEGSKCRRNDSFDIFGKERGNETLDLFKVVVGFKPGDLIPSSARYLTTILIDDQLTHYFEVKGSELDKETVYNYDNYTKENTA